MTEDEKAIISHMMQKIDKFYIAVRDNIEKLHNPIKIINMDYKNTLELIEEVVDNITCSPDPSNYCSDINCICHVSLDAHIILNKMKYDSKSRIEKVKKD